MPLRLRFPVEEPEQEGDSGVERPTDWAGEVEHQPGGAGPDVFRAEHRHEQHDAEDAPGEGDLRHGWRVHGFDAFVRLLSRGVNCLAARGLPGHNRPAMSVPYFSQWRDVADEAWRGRACGLACASMVLAAHGIEASPDELLAEARAMTGHLEWTRHGAPHAAICALLRNRGLHSYHEEFRGRRYDAGHGHWRDDLGLDRAHLDYGLAKIRAAAERDEPVIVSVAPKFRTNEEGHLVVVAGVTEDGFLVHDPDDRSGAGEEVAVSADYLEDFFRRFAVFASRD